MKHDAVGTAVGHRRVPHSHPGVKPVAVHANPSKQQHTSLHRRKSGQHVQLLSDTDSAMQASSSQGRTIPFTRTGSRHQPAAQSASTAVICGQFFPTDCLEQPSQAPQDSGDSESSQTSWRGPKGSTRQAHVSSSGIQAVSRSSGAAGQGGMAAAVNSPSTSASCQGPPGFANPSSDGRTVVVNGFRKGMAGPEARQKAMDMCMLYGQVSACWLRKGKSSCWFVIAQFAEVIAVAFCKGPVYMPDTFSV